MSICAWATKSRVKSALGALFILAATAHTSKAEALNTIDNGWYASDGWSITTNNNTYAGYNTNYPNLTFNDWYAFNLGSLSGQTVSSATLTLFANNGSFYTNSSSETLSLFDYTGSTGSLLNGTACARHADRVPQARDEQHAESPSRQRRAGPGYADGGRATEINAIRLRSRRMDMNVQAKPRMPPIENFADDGPVGVLKPCCTIVCGLTQPWATDHRLRKCSCQPSPPGRRRSPDRLRRPGSR
jgi:hypothetical protein